MSSSYSKRPVNTKQQMDDCGRLDRCQTEHKCPPVLEFSTAKDNVSNHHTGNSRRKLPTVVPPSCYLTFAYCSSVSRMPVMLLEAGNGSNSAGRCMIRHGASELAFSQAPHIDHRQQGRQRRTAGNGFVAETAPVGEPLDGSPKEKPKPSFSRYQSYKIHLFANT